MSANKTERACTLAGKNACAPSYTQSQFAITSAFTKTKARSPALKSHLIPTQSRLIPMKSRLIIKQSLLITFQSSLLPMQFRLLPLEDRHLPMEDCLLRLEVVLLPMQAGVLPMQVRHLPTQARLLPKEDCLLTLQASPLPMEARQLPLEADKLPTQSQPLSTRITPAYNQSARAPGLHNSSRRQSRFPSQSLCEISSPATRCPASFQCPFPISLPKPCRKTLFWSA